MPELKKSAFWMVYGLGAGGPTHQHPTEESAIREAKRLARTSREMPFVVLRSTHTIKFDDCTVDEMEVRPPMAEAVVGRDTCNEQAEDRSWRLGT